MPLMSEYQRPSQGSKPLVRITPGSNVLAAAGRSHQKQILTFRKPSNLRKHLPS